MSRRRKSSHRKKLQVLTANLKPIPFRPLKSQAFSTHQSLLRRLGLWDFVNLDFDRLGSTVRVDLIAQLVAGFDRKNRSSVVDGVRVPVCCAELARAMKLPEKRDSEGTGMGMATSESIRFVEDFVFDWMVLRDESDETWIIPKEISDWLGAVKEGKFEKVDWAAMVWFMVEDELTRGRELRNCYYATHMMCLIQVPSSKLWNFDVCEAKMKIEEQNAVMEAQRAVIEDQTSDIKAKTTVIKKQQKQIGLFKAMIKDPNADIKAKTAKIKEYKAMIEKRNAGIREYKAMIEEQQKREGLYKAKIDEQEKEQALMVNLLEAYREALKRDRKAFAEFRESCECKHLHEPIYKYVPGSSVLVCTRGLKP